MAEKKSVRQEVREEMKRIREERKRIRSLSGEEKNAAKAALKQGIKDRKASAKTLQGEEKKSAKKFNRMLGRRLHPVRTVLSRVSIAFVCVLAIAIGVVYMAFGALLTRALTAALPVDTPEAKKVQEISRADVITVAEEGIILLKNEDNVLPLSSGNINVFGTGSVNSVFGGGGSGSADTSTAVTLRAGLENNGFVCNPSLSNLYANWVNLGVASTEDADAVDTSQARGLEQTVTADYSVNELPAQYLKDDIMSDAKAFSDTAIVVFSRTGSEGTDLRYEYLQLTTEERDLLNTVCKTFDKVVVLVNAVNPMELGFLEEYPQIKGALSIGAVGNTGMYAVGEILSGAVNPSGKTVDTYAYDLMSNPANLMIGSTQWSESGYPYSNLDNTYFINYYEGIYVGYRYYETRFAGDEAGYQANVQYPFGYGLSYTDFEWEITDYQSNNEDITVTVKVTNTGSVAGKDVVELYFSAPYYPERGIEKSATELSAFAKTELLAPGQSETVTLTYKVRDMASFDGKTEKAYVLDEGDYEIRLCTDSHTVVDTRVYHVDNRQVYNNDNVTGTAVTAQFEDAAGDITYLSRNDWEGTWPNLSAINSNASDETVSTFDWQLPDASGAEKPVTGAKNGLMLSDLKGLDYDDPQWDAFLDQMTIAEMATQVVSGGYGTEGLTRLGIPGKKDMDGPAAINNVWAGTSGVQFPAGIVIASTWNTEMAELVGHDIAVEARTYDVVGWYAPGANLHRSAFGGRNFEYFSEDPLLSGKMAAAEISAAEELGLVVYLKHFALNEQENNRNTNGLYTWCYEQAIRELYLTPFEIAVKEGKPLGVMSSFNRIGNTWTGGSSALLRTVLRDEWGFHGVVVSDATQSIAWPYMNQAQGVMNGNDLFLNYSSVLDSMTLKSKANGNALLAQELRNACHNILYSVANSAAVE